MARIVKVADPANDKAKPYEVRWSWYDAEGKRHFKKARYRTRREADAKRREVEDAVAAANLPDYAGGKESVTAWGERWLDSREPLVKISTYRSYLAIWNTSVKPTWGGRRISAISTADVQDWVTQLLRSDRKPPTIKHHVWLLGQVVASAVRARAITYNPVRDVQLPTDRAVGRLPHQPHFLTAEEVEVIAAAMSETTHGALVRFMAWTGLRTGEVSGLNVGDVDLMRRTLTVRRTAYRDKGNAWREDTPKSGKGRTVPLMPWITDDLRALLAIHPNRNDASAPLWPGAHVGGHTHGTGDGPASGALDWSSRWEPATFRRNRFKPALTGAGVTRTVRLHDLRHSFASLCASEGIPSAQVAQWMGHASDVITREVYTHLFDHDTAKYAERLAARGRPRAPRPVREATVTDLRRAR